MGISDRDAERLERAKGTGSAQHPIPNNVTFSIDKAHADHAPVNVNSETRTHHDEVAGKATSCSGAHFRTSATVGLLRCCLPPVLASHTLWFAVVRDATSARRNG